MRVLVLEVLVDRRGIVDHDLFVDEDRNLAERIQLEKLRPLLFAATKVDVDELVRKLLLGKHDSYLLAEGALRVVIELHRFNHLLSRSADLSSPFYGIF